MKKWIFTLFVLPLSVLAQQESQFKQELKGFQENKGQFMDQNRLPNSEVLYLLSNKGLNVQLKANGFSYDTYKNDHFHRIDIRFGGSSNPKADLKLEQICSSADNYYVNGLAVRDVKRFQKITYQSLYPNIDLEFIVSEKSDKFMEYNFILHPGADINDIRLDYNGASLKLSDEKQLIFETSNGSLTEHIPASYYLDGGKKVDVSYRVLRDEGEKVCIGFESAEDLILSKTLIIDPTPNISWSTYYGGTSDDKIHKVLTSSDGIFICGETSSLSNIATSGTHQTSLSQNFGTTDAFVAKFNTNGQRVWGTYFGGLEYEYGNSIAMDNSGNIIMIGTTYSSESITNGSGYQNALRGYTDAFLVKFNGNGDFVWSTYFGGFDQEYGNDLCVDASNNIYITGKTNSYDLPVLGNIHQVSNNGFNEAFLSKFNSNGSNIWTTYFGGSGDDEGNAIMEKNGSIYLGGTTGSSDYISTFGSNLINDGTSTWYKDAFCAKFDNLGNLTWAKYIGGDSDEQLYDLVLDGNENVILVGQTNSSAYLSTSGAAQTTYGGYYDGFVSKLTSSATESWTTYMGGNDIDLISGVAVDPSNNIYTTGHSASQSSIYTNNAYQGFKGIVDNFIVKYTTSGSKIYGTYFGGSFDEDKSSIAIASDESIFLAGSTYSSDFIAVNASYQATSNGSYEGFLTKFIADCIPDAPTNTTAAANLAICPGTTTTLTATGTSITWFTSPSGGTQVGSGSSFTTPVLNSNTTYYAQANGCSASSRIAISITMKAVPTISITASTTNLCQGMPLTLNATGGNNITWNNGVINGQSFNATSTMQYIASGTSTSTGCSGSASITITVKPAPAITANASSTTVCSGTPITLFGGGGNSYTWNNGISNNVPFLLHNTGTYSVTGVGSNGCSNTAQITVTADHSADPSFTRSGSSFVASNAGGIYKWLECPSMTIVGNNFNFSPANDFTEYALVVSKNGCTDTSGCRSLDNIGIVELTNSELISIFPNPGNGLLNISSKTLISGIRIYDSAGKLSFEQQDKNNFFQLNLVDLAAGVYVIELTLSDAVLRTKLVRE